jgi:fucose permease
MVTSFVLLGMPMAAMGVAWPSAADDLGRTLADLGLVTFAYGSGYTLSTLALGELNRRFSTGPVVVFAAFAAAASLAAFAVTSVWVVFLAAGFTVGIAGGLLDAGVNAYVAVRRGARSMGLIHTGFGVGSALGPLFVTALIALGASWRIAFATLAGADLVLAVAYIFTVGAIESTAERAGHRPSIGGNRPVLALSMLVFFLYAGIAGSTGAWAYSLLTEGRGIATGIAGMAVAGYWGGMTAARMALGVFGDRIDPNRALTASGIGTISCLALLWLAPTPWLGIAGLVASGFAHGSVFPLEVLLTPGRFGHGFTPWAVGYEIAGANIGVALLSAAFGILVARWTIAAVAPALVILAVLLWASIEMLRVRSTRSSVATG